MELELKTLEEISENLKNDELELLGGNAKVELIDNTDVHHKDSKTRTHNHE